MDERRRYFRINDDFVVRILRADAEVLQGVSDTSALRQVLNRIRGTSPDLADAITIIERRVTALEDAESGRGDYSTMAPGVNISGCGAAFFSAEYLDVGKDVRLLLLFDDGALSVAAKARVVSCEQMRPSGQHSHLVRVDLFGMSPEDEELLVQYVLRRQIQLIRKQRQTNVGPSAQA